MYYTNEYTVLKSLNGGEDIVLKPGLINKFGAFEGEYRPTSSAMIIDEETKKIVSILNVKEVFTGVGTIPKPKPTPKKVEEPTLLEPEDG